MDNISTNKYESWEVIFQICGMNQWNTNILFGIYESYRDNISIFPHESQPEII